MPRAKTHLEVLKIEIAKLQLAPDDILVLRGTNITHDDVTALAKITKHKVIALRPSLELTKLTPELIDEISAA